MENTEQPPTLPCYRTRDKYRILKQLSKGSYGDVFLAERIHDGLHVCLKQVDLDFLSPHERLGCLSEVRLLQALPPHPHVVACFDAFWDDTSDLGGATRLMLVLEYGDAGDLESLVQTQHLQQRALPVDTALGIFAQIVSGLSFLHERHVLHRDIKSKNIFRFVDGRVVIGDFGTCKPLAHTTALASTFVGSPLYMSPELLEGQPYSYSSDIWSLGCLFYELFAGTTPFVAPSYPAVVFRITKGTFEPLSSTVPVEIQVLVARMLSLDPAKRPTVEELLCSPPIRSYIYSPEVPTVSLAECNADGSPAIVTDAVVVLEEAPDASTVNVLEESSEDHPLLLPPPPPTPMMAVVVEATQDPLPLTLPLPPQPAAKTHHKARRTISPVFPTNRASIANILSRERLNIHKERTRQSAIGADGGTKFLSCIPVMEPGVSVMPPRKPTPPTIGVKAGGHPVNPRQPLPLENMLIIGTKVNSLKSTKSASTRR